MFDCLGAQTITINTIIFSSLSLCREYTSILFRHNLVTDVFFVPLGHDRYMTIFHKDVLNKRLIVEIFHYEALYTHIFFYK